MSADQKVALVTGGASGIGRGAVELLVEKGWAVAIADLDAGLGEALASELAAGGAKIVFLRTDVSDEDSVQAMVAGTLAAFGRIDGAINSAGLEGYGEPMHMLTAEQWDRCVNVNLRGMFFCMKHQVAAMLEGGGGSIVAVSSAAAVMGMVNSADYCASKAGVTGLVRAVAVDYVKQGIRANSILPGATATPLAKRASVANAKSNTGYVQVPIGRMAQPREIATAAVWLLSDEASYITGASFPVDGAMTTV